VLARQHVAQFACAPRGLRFAQLAEGRGDGRRHLMRRLTLEPFMARLLTNADLRANVDDAFARRAMQHGVNELEAL
jgi:hypothetical protein